MTARDRVLRAIPVVAVWAATMVTLAVFRQRLAHPPAWLGLLGAAANLVALGAGWAVSARALPKRLHDELGYWLLVVSAPLFLLIETTGGLRSPAVLVPGFVALGLSWRYSLARGATGAAIWGSARVTAELLRHR